MARPQHVKTAPRRREQLVAPDYVVTTRKGTKYRRFAWSSKTGAPLDYPARTVLEKVADGFQLRVGSTVLPVPREVIESGSAFEMPFGENGTGSPMSVSHRPDSPRSRGVHRAAHGSDQRPEKNFLVQGPSRHLVAIAPRAGRIPRFAR